tara:strand:- start:234 stop:662 length:429 start_codon:yes stop_codon:yes gene_type:complete
MGVIMKLSLSQIINKLMPEKARLMGKIEQRGRRDFILKAILVIRYIGLVLIQGSSALILLDHGMMLYWSSLWLGLLCYEVTAIFKVKDAFELYTFTRKKFEDGLGSSQDTVDDLRNKRWDEFPYVLGNTLGLILVGLNWMNS